MYNAEGLPGYGNYYGGPRCCGLAAGRKELQRLVVFGCLLTLAILWLSGSLGGGGDQYVVSTTTITTGPVSQSALGREESPTANDRSDSVVLSDNEISSAGAPDETSTSKKTVTSLNERVIQLEAELKAATEKLGKAKTALISAVKRIKESENQTALLRQQLGRNGKKVIVISPSVCPTPPVPVMAEPSQCPVCPSQTPQPKAAEPASAAAASPCPAAPPSLASSTVLAQSWDSTLIYTNEGQSFLAAEELGLPGV